MWGNFAGTSEVWRDEAFCDMEHTKKFAKLINAGCLAVRELDPQIPIALHNHLGRDNDTGVPDLSHGYENIAPR